MGAVTNEKIEEFFVENYRFMFVMARKVLRQKADAEDVIQSLLFKALDWELPPTMRSRVRTASVSTLGEGAAYIAGPRRLALQTD
jgi:hypothetical protein